MIEAIVIVVFLLVLVSLFVSKIREEKLSHIVVVQRNRTFKNDFTLWTDLQKKTIEKVVGVTSVFWDQFDGKFRITTDPRIGREKVIDKILDLVEGSYETCL